MSDSLCFTFEECALIDGVISALYSKMSGEALRSAYRSVHEHLQSGCIDSNDLQRIESALAFVDPGSCVSCNKESYRDLTVVRLKTQAMRCSC